MGAAETGFSTASLGTHKRMTSLENKEAVQCPRCGGPLIKVDKKKYNKIDLVGASLVGIIIFNFTAYFIITDTNKPSRWPMAIVALALAIGYILKKFVSYKVTEVIKCKYCGKGANETANNT